MEKLNAIASSYDFERRKSSLPTKKKRADWLKSVSGSLDRIVNNLPLDRQFEGDETDSRAHIPVADNAFVQAVEWAEKVDR